MKLTPIASNMTELELSNGTTVLFSYKTPVAAFVSGKGIVRTEKFFSQTTSKHINKWIRENASSATVTQVPQEEIESLVK